MAVTASWATGTVPGRPHALAPSRTSAAASVGRRATAVIAIGLALAAARLCLATGGQSWRLEVERKADERRARCDPSVAPIRYGAGGAHSAATSADGSRFALVVLGPERERQEVRVVDRRGKLLRRIFITDTSDCPVKVGKDEFPPVPKRVFERVAAANAFLRKGKYEGMEAIAQVEGAGTDGKSVHRTSGVVVAFDPETKALSVSAHGKSLVQRRVAPLRVKGPRSEHVDCSGPREPVRVSPWMSGEWLVVEVFHYASDECNVLGLTTWVGPIHVPPKRK